jgi:hypothetical protein
MFARSMKTNYLAFDDVADSMSAAAGRLGVPLEAVKAAKRSGSTAFRGSRVNVPQLREEIGSPVEQSRPADVLLIIIEQVARIVSEKVLLYKDARFRRDSRKLTQAIQLGFGAAVCVCDPDEGDHFLRQSAALM